MRGSRVDYFLKLSRIPSLISCHRLFYVLWRILTKYKYYISRNTNNMWNKYISTFLNSDRHTDFTHRFQWHTAGVTHVETWRGVPWYQHWPFPSSSWWWFIIRMMNQGVQCLHLQDPLWLICLDTGHSLERPNWILKYWTVWECWNIVKFSVYICNLCNVMSCNVSDYKLIYWFIGRQVVLVLVGRCDLSRGHCTTKLSIHPRSRPPQYLGKLCVFSLIIPPHI